MSVTALDLRDRAGALAGRLPPLMADARRLAATVLLGDHGRRQAGPGSEFWQYRIAMPGDQAQRIDWRRSGRSDTHYIREREWQAAQTVTFWIDPGQNMAFTSDPKKRVTKHDRATILGLALAVLLEEGGERIGLAGRPAGIGAQQVMRMAEDLSAPAQDDYTVPQLDRVPARSMAVLISDFFAPIEPLIAQVGQAADRGVRGALVQINDPAEESFPFKGRTLFQSVGGGMLYEVQKALTLKADYKQRLAERRDALAKLAKSTGWQLLTHHTDQTAQAALLWLYGAIGKQA
ncbi:MAG: DUF58 domain-containing protein [Deltaproteobacteria bacterium]